ncbi:hypothetical protein FRC00_012859, partial [Tulasnella sp. 408]
MDALEFFRLIAFQSAVTRYCMVAGYVWVLYDWFITLDQEIDLVWRRSGAWKSKVLYAFTRYHGLALLTYDLVVMLGSDWSSPFCKAYFFILGGCGLALLFAVEGALQLRIYVMYHSSLKVLVVNGIIFVLEMACMTCMFLVDTIQFERKHNPMRTPPGLKGCFATSAEVKYSKAMWWVCLAFETYLSMFVFRVAISHIRAYGAGSHILYILIRDSLVWFVLLALCLLWNAVAWSAAPIFRVLHLINRISTREQPGLSLTGIPALHASATIGGCRMLLNLRAAYFESLQPRDIDSTAVSVFATDASIGRFRSLWTSSRKEDKPRQPTTSTADQALDHDDDRKAAERRYSIGMESWTSLNDHDHDRAHEGIVRRASQVPPPLALHAGSSPTSPRRHLSPRQVDFGLSDVDIELQDL